MATTTGTHLLSRTLFLSSPFSRSLSLLKSPPFRLRFHKPLSLSASTATAAPTSDRHSLLLDRLRSRHLKDAPKPPKIKNKPTVSSSVIAVPSNVVSRVRKEEDVGKDLSFEELGLSEEVMGALKEMGIEAPTEIQRIGIPAVMEGQSVVLGSHTGSGKTLAYMLPLVQLLRRDEEMYGMLMKPRRPRAVVLCPTRELSEQVFRVAKSISHHARFRSTMISGGGRIRPQEDSLNIPVDMVVGTPGRVLQHIKDGNIVYGDIKYLVLDEADTMFDRGFGPDIRNFLGPLKKRTEKPGDQGFQTVLVTATMTKAVQKLVDEEFQGIVHLRTSTLHKKIASARHDFIKLSGGENKLESLLQVLEPSLSKGNRVMVFCNTLNSSRAVDHFLTENQIFTVNYHGEVPAAERVENLKKFKSEEGDCPTLVCTDLAARGLDLDVDHVIMFDFPLNSIDYLHRTGRTARMGAKGKVTSLVTKKDWLLATRIEDAIKKNESLESLNSDNVRWNPNGSRQTDHKGSSSRQTDHKGRNSTIRITKSPINEPTRGTTVISKSLKTVRAAQPSAQKGVVKKTGTRSAPSKGSRKGFSPSKPVKSNASRPSTSKGNVSKGKKPSTMKSNMPSKLRVVGFRGRSSSGKREAPRPS